MRRALLLAAATLLVALVAAQVLLPGLAANRLRSDLERNGSRVHVAVEAFPAVKLLWQRADRVTVDVAGYRSATRSDGDGDGTSLPDLLAQTGATNELDVHVGVLEDRLLRMQDVRLRKAGDALIAELALTTADVDAALPARLRVTGGSGSDGLLVAGTTSVFGRELRAQARILPDDEGRIVLQPAGIPFASLVTVPIFSDDRVAVDEIDARPTADGFAITARGHLRG